jgi:ABC-2 type transport system ATP-binding protein
MMENALSIRGLTKDFGDFRLDGVSFDIPRGAIMGLIGPNGAGKTTVIKLLLNLLRRDAGEVRVFGVDARAREAEVKLRVGFVHDTPFFYEHLSCRRVKDTVAPFYPGWDEVRFDSLMRDFGLPPARIFGKLSRGMKMKFALALALSHDADLLILDEPTTGLDPVFRRDLLSRLLEFIQDEGKAVLFSTHITTDLERIADHITFLRGGRIVFSTPKDDLLDRWAVVKGGKELLDPGLAGSFRAVRERDFYVEALTDDAAGIRRRLGERAVIEKASLEDIMFYLTRTNGHA